MIVITGAAGFIGSNLVQLLNQENIYDLILVDSFTNKAKERNYAGTKYQGLVERDDFFNWLEDNHSRVKFIFHLGARTNTAEFDKSIFEKLNLGYSKRMWASCTRFGIPLIYASSAATYGSGEMGYSDDHRIINDLKPLNPYGESKNDFDKWILGQKSVPPFWAGLKFFNVYGPGEYHKGRMASVVYHAYNQIRETGKMKLFRSDKPGIPDGGQSRDFIYVADVVKVIYWLSNNKPQSALYNLGTGKARSFLELTRATFNAMQIEPVIEFIDTPVDIRDKYQYFTEAKMEKLRNTGFTTSFYSLEAGVTDYVRKFLMNTR
ncbi:MAG TPA: ADP-glyceromanno-heptose 6-epimerase [Bacteroidales bacterium]|jgi:ADP-L-glycero-D-manno-heptose 6-epimerase|nr:ADP-glyceromanno-heptose 6-epimerase [Bacteroidales bacterium]